MVKMNVEGKRKETTVRRHNEKKVSPMNALLYTFKVVYCKFAAFQGATMGTMSGFQWPANYCPGTVGRTDSQAPNKAMQPTRCPAWRVRLVIHVVGYIFYKWCSGTYAGWTDYELPKAELTLVYGNLYFDKTFVSLMCLMHCSKWDISIPHRARATVSNSNAMLLVI